MKKHVWEYFFKDEEELKKQWWYTTSDDLVNDTVGCASCLFLFSLFGIGILLILAFFFS